MSTATGEPIVASKDAALHPIYDVSTVGGFCAQCLISYNRIGHDRFNIACWVLDLPWGLFISPGLICFFLTPYFSNFVLAGPSSAELCTNVSMPVVCFLRFGLFRCCYSDRSKDYKGRGAMHGSALYGNWLTTLCLVKCCCFDVNPLDDEGKTPLDLSLVLYDSEFDRIIKADTDSSVETPARQYISYTGRKIVSLFLSKVGGKTNNIEKSSPPNEVLHISEL
jgi:hypothetical protein